MKTTTTHCVAGANGSSDRASGEKPAVATVESECATALKSVIRGSMPSRPNSARIATSSTVIARYRPTKRRPVWRIVVARESSGPGISVLNRACRPPIRRRGSTARKRTMIPTPPSQAVNWRHMSIDCGRAGMSVSTLDPVVENPDIDSKNASTGRASCGTASTYGNAPKTATRNHSSETTR